MYYLYNPFTVSLTAEELDGVLLKLESGMDVALQRAKVWSKYAKDIIIYIEKRASLGKLSSSHL